MTDDNASSSDRPDDDLAETERSTAPMSRFDRSAVAYGLVVLALGLAVTVAIPVLWTV